MISVKFSTGKESCRGGYFSTTGNDAHKKIHGIMRKENYLDVLKPNLYMSARKLKHGQHWDLQQDNDSKYPYEEVAK